MVNVGLLGATGIAPGAMIRPARRRNDVEVLAVAARRAESAEAYAAEHGIPRHYEGYEALIADPDVELVYNALPPSEHCHWTIAALEAGKHVLCEKPIAMNGDEARRMVAAAEASGRRLIEAFHDRYHPLSAEISAVRASGVLGELISVRADFSGTNHFDAASLRHDPALGGGSLMDLGCYPVHWVRTLMGEQPTVLRATATHNPLGADLSMTAELVFRGGVQATVTSAMVEYPLLSNYLEVVGDRGSLRVDNPVFPSTGHSLTTTVDGLDRQWTVSGLTTYDHQLDAVVNALATGDILPTEGADIVSNMQLIDEIYAAAGMRA